MGRPSKNDDLPFFTRYLLSAVSATVAETVTYPIDITKTRLQLQGQKHTGGMVLEHRGIWQTFMGVIREEGFWALYRGLPAAVLRHVVYTGARFGVYEQLRENVIGRDPDGSFPMHKAVIAGMLGGGIAQFIASPTDLVKVLLQAEGRRVLMGHAPKYAGTADCFRQVYQEAGVLGMWRGWIPNVQRAALVNLGELTAYDSAKQRILKYTTIGDTPLCHTISSFCAGITAATFGTPADVIKSRIMAQDSSSGAQKLYRGALHCFVKTVKEEGVMALYKGWLPNWARMAPWSWTFWITYEQLRVITGVGSF